MTDLNKQRLEEANKKRELARKNKKMRGFKGAEKTLQSACEDYLSLLNIRFVHIPDRLWQYLAQKAPIHIKTIASRYLKGVPDLLIFYRDNPEDCGCVADGTKISNKKSKQKLQ